MNSLTENREPISASPYSDEIDLFELIADLWKEKWIIISTTLIAGIIAVAYALLATPIYQTRSVIKPAELKDLDELNSLSIYSISADEALKEVGARLESYKVRFDFFKENSELFSELKRDNQSLEQAFEQFNAKSVKIIRPDAKNHSGFSDYVGVQVTYPKGIDGVAIVNGFIDYAIADEKQHIQNSLEVLISNRLETLRERLEILRVGYKATTEAEIARLTEQDVLKRSLLNDELEALRLELQERREHRIASLEEAIKIATRLGIKKPTNPTSLGQEISTGSNVIRTEVNNQQAPLYFMGVDALTAERDALLERESDDFTSNRIIEIKKELKLLEANRQIEIYNARENEDLFLAEIAEVRKEISRLKKLKVDMDKLKLVRIDEPSIEPLSPIKPKKKLVVLIGGLVGFMLGGMIALVRIAMRNRKQTGLN